MVKRIMRAFKISEVSAVDKPAQEGARMVIMKRDSAGDISSAVTELCSSNARFDKLLRALKEPATTVVSLAERRHTIGKGATPMPVFDTDRNSTGTKPCSPKRIGWSQFRKGGSPLWRPSLTKEQRFTRSIHGVDPEHGKGNPIGDLLYKAYKAAPRATPPQSPAPVDLAAAVAKRAGSASEKMLALAREHQRIFRTNRTRRHIQPSTRTLGTSR